MASSITSTMGKETMVGMGQATAARAPDRLWSILGSCVAVALCDSQRQTAALSHVVLPSTSGRTGMPGKFADTAVPHMLQLLREMGIPSTGLVAKIAGGARMFGHPMPMEVGENNVQSILRELAAAGIRVVGKDVGGDKGRRVSLDCASGGLRIEVLGKPPLTL